MVAFLTNNVIIIIYKIIVSKGDNTVTEPKMYTKSVNEAYRQRQSIIVLGLTGKTGSGCTTVSSILKSPTFDSLGLSTPKDHDFQNIDERKYSVVYKYMKQKGKWIPFYVIHASSIIFSYILETGFDDFSDFIEHLQEQPEIRIPSSKNLTEDINKMRHIFNGYSKYKKIFSEISSESLANDDIKNFLFEKLPKWRESFAEILNNHTIIRSQSEDEKQIKSALYVYVMQTVGNNIRCSGNPYNANHEEKHFYDVAKRMDTIIQFLLRDSENENLTGDARKPVRICIDAIRNSYEALYFKDKYSFFYLLSVNTDESERKRRLGMFDQDELDSLDQTEFAKDDPHIDRIFYHQNMNECLSLSDIHIYNPRQESTGKYSFLSEQLLKYLCLMLHPGIIAPTAIERCMQTAYVAKLNSGCLSRQVGAVITDQDFSIKAIGWNDVPRGQIPCNLRCTLDYANNCDKETFSDFERQDKDVHKALTSIQKAVSECNLNGLEYSFCFKDVYNAVKKSNNQVYTRALHAEENAFLQISKYGGMGIKGGKLFSTASPCELCSKKAFQLGIKEIYYIDPYPGISQSHILHFGTKFRPSLNSFYGAIGNAYVNLYTPRIPLKDELELLIGKTPKDILTGENSFEKESSAQMGLIEFQERIDSFIFYDREHMREIDSGVFSVRKSGKVKYFSAGSFWSGNEFNGFKLQKFETESRSNPPLKKLEDLKCEPLQDTTSKLNNTFIYSCRIPFSRALEKDDQIKYELYSEMSDMEHTMYPYYAQVIRQPLKTLKLRVFEPKGLFRADSIKVKIYSGDTISDAYLLDEPYDCTFEHMEGEELESHGNPVSGTWHNVTIKNPNIFDCYCICWEFS